MASQWANPDTICYSAGHFGQSDQATATTRAQRTLPDARRGTRTTNDDGENLTMSVDELRKLVLKALEDLKAENIVELDVRDKTDVMDYIVVASGNSSRHVKAIANNVVMDAKKAGILPMGVEGETEGEWMLVDLADVVVHVMQPQVRDFYDLENLWQVDLSRQQETF